MGLLVSTGDAVAVAGALGEAAGVEFGCAEK